MRQEILHRFFEGTASFEQEEAVRQWMEYSPENRKAFFKERKLFDAMVLLGDGNEVKEKRRRTAIRFSSLRTEILKIAAIVVFTLGATFLFQQMNSEEELVEMQTISVPVGQRINLTLPDGTNVWLNARTTLKYPAVFSKNARQVILDGEAYFDVAKNKKKPFRIHTDKCDLEVLGTKFNVEAYSGRDEFETTLMEGKVKVVAAVDPMHTLVLAPDSKAFLEDGKLKVKPVDDYNPYRWKEGLICFKNETFRSIMNDFEKYYGVSIQVENKKILKYYFTGKFRQTDGIDYALRVLQKDIRFVYHRDDENQIIYIR